MGIDEEAGTFFGVYVRMKRVTSSETFVALDCGGFIVVARGPLVILSREEAHAINEKSKAGGAFPAGIMSRISQGGV